MRIGGLQKSSLIDFPGKIAAVVFTQGCNLRCPYCHNPELVVPQCFGKALDEAELWSFLQDRRGKLDGVVVSGGEPTLHADLPDFIRRIKELGYAVKLDTNGTNPEMLRTILVEGLLDFVAMDVKAPLHNYATLAGKRIDVELIRTSIWTLKHSGVAHEFRTTVVPGLHTVRELKAIADLLHGASSYVVQEFSGDNPLRSDLQGRNPFPFKPLRDMRAYVERRVERYDVRYSDAAKNAPAANGPTAAVA